MPFNPAGAYTQVNGAVTAQAGDVIRSVTWNAIHTDIGNCLSQLGQLAIQPARTVTTPGNIQVTTTDVRVIIQASAPIINLPASSTKVSPVTIMGGAPGIFASNPSVLTPNGVETISGLATVTLNSNFQVITLFPLPTGGYLIQ